MFEVAPVDKSPARVGETVNDQDWDDREVSIFDVATTMLRHRWRLIRWMIVGALVAVLPILWKPAVYVSSASLISQNGGTGGVQGLAALVGGASLMTSGSSQSPEFYVMLLRSRELLRPITQDTFVVQEQQGKRITFFDLFNLHGASDRLREDRGFALLQQITAASSDKMTGVVSVSASTPWPSVSLAITTAMIDGLNAFNQRTRQSQAAAERKFIEGRLAVATQDLRLSEDRLQSFLTGNKQYQNSPELTFAQDRLRRDLTLKQQVFSSLTASYEDARIREIRDIPVITVIEAPSVASTPESRGRLKRGVLGLIAGGALGVLLVLVSEMLRRGRSSGSPEANEFFRMLGDIRRNLLGWIPGFRSHATP